MELPAHAKSWPAVSAKHMSTLIRTLPLSTKAFGIIWKRTDPATETVEQMLRRTPLDVAGRIGPSAYLELWETLFYLDHPKPTKAAKVDVASLPQGCITLIRKWHPSRGTIDCWAGPVAMDKVVADHITALLTQHQFLPNAGLQAQVAQQVFCKMVQNQKVALKCGAGEVTIEFKWDFEGKELTVRVFLRGPGLPGFYKPFRQIKFLYADKKRFVEEQVGGLPNWLEGIRRDVRDMLKVRLSEAGVQIDFDPEKAWNTSEFDCFRERGIPAKEVFAAIDRGLCRIAKEGLPDEED